MISTDQSLLRLYSQAKREQWNSASLTWSDVDLSAAPPELRRQLAWLTTQILRGELTSLDCAGRLVGQLTDVPARLMASTQVMDEARHVEWFSTLQQKLGEPGVPDEAMLEFTGLLEKSSTTEETFVSLQVLEVVAHTLFLELARRLLDAPLCSSSLTLLGSWRRDLLARDEARHLAFGQLSLAALLHQHPGRVPLADHRLDKLCSVLPARGALPPLRVRGSRRNDGKVGYDLVV